MLTPQKQQQHGEEEPVGLDREWDEGRGASLLAATQIQHQGGQIPALQREGHHGTPISPRPLLQAEF